MFLWPGTVSSVRIAGVVVRHFLDTGSGAWGATRGPPDPRVPETPFERFRVADGAPCGSGPGGGRFSHRISHIALMLFNCNVDV
jgi:hypothetical protein